MHATSIGTINHENSVLVLLLVHRRAVKADRKWRCKQIYSYFEGLYCIFSKNFRKFSGNINFRKFSGKIGIIFRRKFPEEISGLTTLISAQPVQFSSHDVTVSHRSYYILLNKMSALTSQQHFLKCVISKSVSSKVGSILIKVVNRESVNRSSVFKPTDDRLPLSITGNRKRMAAHFHGHSMLPKQL